MLERLPYRAQIPLGLSVAVVIAALLVTVVSARISAKVARLDTLATVDRAVVLLAAQARPMLTADDTWRIFTLLKSTAALLPGGEARRARAAVLDAEGRVVAASQPQRLATGSLLLGARDGSIPDPSRIDRRWLVDDPDAGLRLVDAILSEDGQVQGFVYAEVDADVFKPDWTALSKPALIGVLLAVTVLVPAGWWIGHRMTRPVVDLANLIDRIGREDPGLLRRDIPSTADPQLGRISGAVDRLIREMQVRHQAERRALSAERMAAVGRLTAAVAHEINNPLAGLLTAAQTLRRHGDNAVAREQTLSLLERGLQQIRATVMALVPQARVEDRPLEENDLADVVTLVLPVAVRQGIELRSRADITAAPQVPSSVLRQVMLNLLVNALKAAGEQGRVLAVLEVDSDFVRFVVSNTGERFTQAQLEDRLAAESGSDPRGFGLWVCREVAMQFGGGFAVHAAPDFATCLQFWIPNRERHEDPAVD